MLRRSRTRQLLLFGMAVALVGHLWMLHDPMPAASGAMVLSESVPALVGDVEPVPRPSGDRHGSDMQFMALTCLAVLGGVAAVWFAVGARQRAPSWQDRLWELQTSPRREVGRSPPVPPPSRVEAGVLLLV